MRALSAATGALIILLGIVAVITGDSTLHGAWLLALTLTALGLAGLVAVATAASR